MSYRVNSIALILMFMLMVSINESSGQIPVPRADDAFREMESDQNKNLDLNLEESDDFDTIGGFLFSLMGKVPGSGEFVKYKNLDIVILEADERSIKKIKITRISRDQDKDERGND